MHLSLASPHTIASHLLCRKKFQKALKSFFKGAKSRLSGLKSLAKLIKFFVCYPCQSSTSLTILVPLWFIITSLMFFYLYKVLKNWNKGLL